LREAGLVTCAGCGAVCDDVAVDFAVEPVSVQPHCAVAERWFAARARADGPTASIAGAPVAVDVALRRAAELLGGARRPLILGFGDATIEAVRQAIALADRLGAVIDTDSDGNAGTALALRGASTATLGEIRDRAQLVVIWREDPQTTHPRLLARLGLTGAAPPAGAPAPLVGERRLVVVDERDTPTAARADIHLRIARERDVEALTRLHGREKGLPLAPSDLDGDLQLLLDGLHAVPHAAFLHGPGLSAGVGGHRGVLALNELVRRLSDARHVVSLLLRPTAGALGAEDALAWQTGYPAAVDLGSGHPEMLRDGRARLHAGEVDVLLAVESDPAEVPEGVAVIAVSSTPVPAADVVVGTAAGGVGVAGTVHRMDGVPLSLQAPLASDRPGAAQVLGRLLEELDV
jgi:formylmethanofuran dehydrogenase subunit B